MSAKKDKREYSTADLRKFLGEALGRAHYKGEAVSISRHGKPYAAVVPQEALDRAHHQGDVVGISRHGEPYVAVVSLEDASFLEKMKLISPAAFNKFKKQINKILEDREGGKDLENIVSEFEQTVSEPKNGLATNPARGIDPAPARVTTRRSARYVHSS